MNKKCLVVWLSAIACLVLFCSPRDAHSQDVENPKHDLGLTGVGIEENSRSTDECDYFVKVQVYINGTDDWQLNYVIGRVHLYYKRFNHGDWVYIVSVPIRRDEMDAPWLKRKVWPDDFASNPQNWLMWEPMWPDTYDIKGQIEVYGATDSERAPGPGWNMGIGATLGFGF